MFSTAHVEAKKNQRTRVLGEGAEGKRRTPVGSISESEQGSRVEGKNPDPAAGAGTQDVVRVGGSGME
jgi:hypothetical protein